MLQAGHVEVVYSQSEKIGLPNWSFLTLMASAKTTVPDAEYDLASNFLYTVVDIFIKERVETVARALNKWANLPTQTLGPGDKQSVVPQGISIKSTELTFSTKETVGLPEKSSIDLLGSVKGVADAGLELVMFEQLAARLTAQMSEKRDLVLANPRPWTSA